MKVTVMKDAEAPRPPKAQSKVAEEILAVLESIKDGKVARVEPEEGQTLRGLKVSFGRVASNNNIKVQSWSLEGENAIYVKRL